jgi:hypothetical protein
VVVQADDAIPARPRIDKDMILGIVPGSLCLNLLS